MLAALLAPGDPLVTLIVPLAWVLVGLLLVGLLGELKRHRTLDAEKGLGLLPTILAVAALAALFARFGSGSGITVDDDLATWDRFEAMRAGGVALVGMAALLLGFNWPRVMGLVAVRAALAVSIGGGLLLVGKALSGGLGPGEGLLGNTGYDMQVLLPGAVAGLFVLALAKRPTTLPALAGGAAFLLAGLFAGLAPVVGGSLVLVLLGLWAMARASQRLPVAGLVAVVALAALGGAPGGGEASQPDGASSSAAVQAPPRSGTPDARLGGVGVRLAVWRSLFDADFPRPVGTGQFQAAYPPYRSPDELAASTGSQTLAEITEVEHPHSDLLLAWAEGRLRFAELAWVLGMLLLIAQALLGARWTNRNALPLVAGAAALLVAGLFHAPLLVNPLAAALGWLLIGAWLGRVRQWRPSLAIDNDGTELVDEPVPSHGPSLAAALAADLDVRGGRYSWTVRMVLPAATLACALPVLSWSPLSPAQVTSVPPPELATVAAARDAAAEGRLPFDVVALRARSLQAKDREAATAFWDLALELRPHSVEALMQRGLMAAMAGDLSEAHWRWSRAAELYPGYPPLVKNLTLLGADLLLSGELEPGLAELDGVLDELGVDPAQRHEPVVLRRAADLSLEPKVRAALAMAAHWLQARRQGEARDLAACRASLERAALAIRSGLGSDLPALYFAGAGPDGATGAQVDPAPNAFLVPTAVVDAAPAAVQVELAACEAATGDLDAARARLELLLEDPRNTPASLLAGTPDWVALTVQILLDELTPEDE